MLLPTRPKYSFAAFMMSFVLSRGEMPTRKMLRVEEGERYSKRTILVGGVSGGGGGAEVVVVVDMVARGGERW